MQMLLKLFAVAVLCLSGLVSCGGPAEPQLEVPFASTEQELYMCADDGTMAGRCPTGYTCVSNSDTCRKIAYDPAACGTGETWCLGYQYPDGSYMRPYCVPEYVGCYTPWAE